MKNMKEMFYSGAILGVLIRDNPLSLRQEEVRIYARYIEKILDGEVTLTKLREMFHLSTDPDVLYNALKAIKESYKVTEV